MTNLFKRYKVVRSKTGELLEEFSSLEASEKFMILMQSKGENVTIKTDDADADENPVTFDIEGMDVETPSVDFGSDLDVYNEGPPDDLEVDDDVNPDIEIG